MRLHRRTPLAAIAALALAMPADAGPPKPLFAGNDVISITIRAPVTTLVQRLLKPGTGLPGPANAGPARPIVPKPDTVITGTLAVAGAPQALAIQISPRGITRRKNDVCSFPPLRIAFTTKPPAGSVFQGQKRLKLVTHCRRDEEFQQHLLLEYAAYRIYNAVTPASFAVRLAKIDYVNDKGDPITSRYGVFIEDADDMAKRSDLHEFEGADRVTMAQLHPSAALRVALFQTMIGNLDWSMNAGPPGAGCCHNIRLIGAKGATAGLIPVPYDFDYSGLVDAPYALSPKAIQSGSVRTRRYRGFCAHNAGTTAAAADLLAERARLIDVLGTIPDLDEGTRKKAVAYLESFFPQAESAPELAARLIKTCI